ncbi:MAG: VCBS repeat-containing protein, partial [Planctomycetaceae bacterium]|nr:VCBS repeat-containing protein [Planctomycetaceae bacterium]
LYYRALWLLNIAAMTIGDYPGGVPSQYQIPPAEFMSTSEFPPFTNIAQEMGVNGFSSSGGAIGEDFDGDGAIDLVVSSWNEVEQVRFLRNNQDGTFSDHTEEAGLKGILGGLNLVHADYNNDGHPDILVLRGGWLGAAGRHPNSLLRNNGDGTFTDVTIHAGLATVNAPTQTATWADFNNDGLVDLFVGNEMEPCQLYINQGDETFVDTATRAGVTNERFSKGTVAGDFNADGHIDIYLSNYGNENRLYQNNGDGTFTDVAQHVGVQGPRESFPCWFWDYNNDGHLDLYVSSFAATIDHVAKDYLDLPLNIELNQLYQSNGKGGFNEVSKSLGLTAPTA